MSTCHIVDAFPAFLEFWPSIRHKTIDEQIDGWTTSYMARWPELLAMQQACYAEDGEDWRQVAREMVFPHLAERLASMEEAHGHLVVLCDPVYARAQESLGFSSDMVAVIYAGIGCGAVWVTTYQAMPAILFGLENAAEEGWTTSRHREADECLTAGVAPCLQAIPQSTRAVVTWMEGGEPPAMGLLSAQESASED